MYPIRFLYPFLHLINVFVSRIWYSVISVVACIKFYLFCILDSVSWILYPVYWILYPCILDSVSCILDSVSCILDFVSSILDSVSCILDFVSLYLGFCILYLGFCILYPVSWILYPVSCILYPVSCILNLVSCVSDPEAPCSATGSNFPLVFSERKPVMVEVGRGEGMWYYIINNHIYHSIGIHSTDTVHTLNRDSRSIYHYQISSFQKYSTSL